MRFGVRVADPYRWLEAGDAPDVRAWVAAEDRLARAHLRALPGRDALRARLRALFYVDEISAPERAGGRLFYFRRRAAEEKAVYYWREGESGAERALLDPGKMSPDGTISIGIAVPSWDGRAVAYTVKRNNSDEAVLHVVDVATGKTSAVDAIEGANYAAPSWTPAGDGFYYTHLPREPGLAEADRPGRATVRFHALGADPRQDPILYGPTGDPQAFLGAVLSQDGHWLVLQVAHGWTATDVFFRDPRARDAAWRPLAVGREAQFNVQAWQDRFYVHTNDGAPRWRVLRADPERPAREDWSEIVPEAADATLEGVQVVGGRLVLAYTRSAASRLALATLDGAPVREVPLPEIGTAGLTGKPDDDVAFFTFESFTRPPEICRTSIASGETALWAKVAAPVDPARFAVEQVFYPSKDGTRVSMFLVRRKGAEKKEAPFLLTGYGGFNVSVLPSFSADVLPWLEAGGGLAVANLRGGGEYGEEWHQAGVGVRKQNVFDDFIAAAEFLVREGFTRPERLAIRGASNGGLLVGAALTQRPELFRVALCEVPLLDMVRYPLFGGGKIWIPEYGSPEDEAELRALAAYSPLHRVRAGAAYPAVLFVSADADDRVDPMHARKMAAALQAASASGRPVLYRVEPNAGHGGADQVRLAVEQSADELAFAMAECGVEFPGR